MSFVITAKLDETSFERLDAWRQAYFPPSRNLLSAHLTLFHTVSASQLSRVQDAWPGLQQAGPPPLRFTAPLFLGRGVAIEVDAPHLNTLHSRLIDIMGGSLTPQDRQRFRAHVTVQNKVQPAAARALYEEFRSAFSGWEGSATAILVWRYLDGPWSLEYELAY